MIKLFRIHGLILMLILSACEKDVSDQIYSSNSGLLYQVKFDSELYHEFTYNESNQILEEKSKYYYTRHIYESGRLISSEYYVDPVLYSSSIPSSSFNRTEWVNPENTEKNSTKAYSYDSEGRIFRSENFSGISEYSYDDKNRIKRQTFFRDSEPTGYIDFIYDDNDNVKNRLHYWILSTGKPELQTTTVYEYDNQHNPYKAFSSLMIPGKYTNTNNIIRETYTLHFDVSPPVEKVQITENKYKYSSEGFPITKNGSETYIYY